MNKAESMKECPYCNSLIKAAAKKCRYCNEWLNKTDANSEIPKEIREELKLFDDRDYNTCLECGYRGLMGIEGKYVPWYASWWFIILVFFPLFLIVCQVSGIVLCIFVALFRSEFVKTIWYCPNCKRMLM